MLLVIKKYTKYMMGNNIRTMVAESGAANGVGEIIWTRPPEVVRGGAGKV